jgi:hypothetical protein
MAARIRVSLNFNKPHLEFAHDAMTVYEGLKDNAAFPKPPISIDVLKEAIDAYLSAMSAAADGGRKAIVERNKLKDELETMLRQLGHWVEANCGQDLGILKSSGFQAAATTKVASVPLAQPVIMKVQNGTLSGEIMLQVKPLERVRTYEVRYATKDAEGKVGDWVGLPPYTTSRMAVSGLSPGATYLFQVRAFGKRGLTDWSDTASRIAV